MESTTPRLEPSHASPWSDAHVLPPDVPERLELIDDLLKERFASARPFEGVTALFMQHQLGSMVPMVEAFVRLGLDPRRLFWIDIPYTSNATVRAAVRKLGVPARNFLPGKFNLTKKYVPYMRSRVVRAIAEFSRWLERDDKLLVMDDGSYFVEALACFRTRPHPVCIVEQTQRGVIKLQRDAAIRAVASQLPIVNVAESQPKKVWESPHIGTSVCRALIARLHSRLEMGPADRCLILGFGAIGRAVAASLTDMLGLEPGRIHVTDPDPASAQAASDAGHPIWDRRADEPVRFKLVVGCAGTTSFQIGDRTYLEDGACLASASSGSAELSREDFIELADAVGEDDVYVKGREDLDQRSIHSDIDIHLVDRVVSFLNGGFPVNFDGAVNCVPWKHIQVTRAIQIAAAAQAVREPRRGLIDLDHDLCDWADRKMRTYLARKAR
jgi:S-adenosylhomocysteine hydrolase